jgi:triacylglycerol lipase
MATSASKDQKTLSSDEELADARGYFRDYDILLIPPIMRAAYSDRMAWILASMSHLAYDRFEDDPKTRELLAAKLASGGFRLLETFNSNATDTQAFLVANGNYAVLAFRGTEVSKKTDILTDARAYQISVIEGRVHGGFREAYESVREEIEKSLLGLDNIPLYITGHSLGAALATVATQELEINSAIRERIAACYTFGSPRVGNTQYDKSLKAPIYRMVNTTDVVTIIPLIAMGYVHIGDVRFLGRKPGDTTRRVPVLMRTVLFIAAMFRLFGPWVGDHAIVEYRRKLEAVAEKRNRVMHSQ